MRSEPLHLMWPAVHRRPFGRIDLQFALQDLKSFQQTVDIAQAQYNAGYISEGDYLKIKLQLLQFQTDV